MGGEAVKAGCPCGGECQGRIAGVGELVSRGREKGIGDFWRGNEERRENYILSQDSESGRRSQTPWQRCRTSHTSGQILIGESALSHLKLHIFLLSL